MAKTTPGSSSPGCAAAPRPPTARRSRLAAHQPDLGRHELAGRLAQRRRWAAPSASPNSLRSSSARRRPSVRRCRQLERRGRGLVPHRHAARRRRPRRSPRRSGRGSASPFSFSGRDALVEQFALRSATAAELASAATASTSSRPPGARARGRRRRARRARRRRRSRRARPRSPRSPPARRSTSPPGTRASPARSGMARPSGGASTSATSGSSAGHAVRRQQLGGLALDGAHDQVVAHQQAQAAGVGVEQRDGLAAICAQHHAARRGWRRAARPRAAARG